MRAEALHWLSAPPESRPKTAPNHNADMDVRRRRVSELTGTISDCFAAHPRANLIETPATIYPQGGNAGSYCQHRKRRPHEKGSQDRNHHL
jgi:hypothetical protein